METYTERLQREIKELQVVHPTLEAMMKEIRASFFMSNMEIDYEVERDARAYRAVQKFLTTLNLPVVKTVCTNCTDTNGNNIGNMYICETCKRNVD
jgi:hypothetical protein